MYLRLNRVGVVKMQRSGKFYRKNEAEVMKMLGLVPTKGSGAGWIEKEDGQNENVICQLKSTDKNSIAIHKLDVDKLYRNASISHKIPVFAIQFIQSNEVFLMCSPEDIVELAKYIQTGEKQQHITGIDLTQSVDTTVHVAKVIKSSKNAREQYNEGKENKYKKERSAK